MHQWLPAGGSDTEKYKTGPLPSPNISSIITNNVRKQIQKKYKKEFKNKQTAYFQMMIVYTSTHTHLGNSAPQKACLSILFLWPFCQTQAWWCYFFTCLAIEYFPFMFFACFLQLFKWSLTLFLSFLHLLLRSLTLLFSVFCKFKYLYMS